jgi:hypothetical protein
MAEEFARQGIASTSDPNREIPSGVPAPGHLHRATSGTGH